MARRRKKKEREGSGKAEPARPRTAASPPPGYLPTADPPRKNLPVLIAASVLMALWMLTLAYLALFG